MKSGVCCTFDVDLVDHISQDFSDEFSAAFPLVKSILSRNPEIHTTWFVRIDEQIRKVFGDPAFVFRNYQAELGWLKDHGHDLGWHHHSFRQEGSIWTPETDESRVVAQLSEFSSVARDFGLDVSRIGWGYMTNAVMATLENAGFVCDSSGMPRPRYPWDKGLRDWSGSESEPYFPSPQDYRRKGDNRSIIEIPMSMVPLSLKTDTQPDVIRYINPAYKHAAFKTAVERCHTSALVMICHPYELMPRGPNVPSLLGFDAAVFEQNLRFLVESDRYRFLTIKQLRNEVLKRLP